MDLSLGGLLAMARDTVSDPREGARRIMAIDLTLQERWLTLLLMAIVSTLIAEVSVSIAPAPPPAPVTQPVQQVMLVLMSNPVLAALTQTAALFTGTLAVHRFGQARGGTGSLADAVSLMAWLQFIMLLLLVAQVLAEVLLPPLAALIGLGSVPLFFWLLTNFVAELHRFRSLGATFAGVIVGLFVLILALAVVMALVLGPFMPAVERG